MADPGVSAEQRPGAWRVAMQLMALHADEPCGDAAAAWPWPGQAEGLDRGAGRDAAEGAGEGPESGTGLGTAAAPSGGLLAIVDGLGHGVDAARSAQAALEALAARPDRPLPDLLAEADRRLLGLRGAAVGLLRVQGNRAWHAGVGNTRCLRWRAGHALRLPSQPGVVGGGLPARIQQTELALAPGDWLLMFTDGVDEMLNLPVWLPEWERDPQLLCQHLLAHCRVGRDDGGVLVAQVPGA